MTKHLEALISSEIADFFAGFDSPGEPRTLQEMQQQLLTRVMTIVSDAVAALEQSEKQRASWKQISQTNISEREKDIAELDAARNLIAELESCGRIEYTRRLERRVAELEAIQLAVKLRKHDVGEVMHVSGFSRDYAEGWCAGNDNAIVEIRAAGGTVQGDE